MNLFYILIVSAVISGCATTASYAPYQSTGVSKPDGCHIDVFAEGLEVHRSTVVVGEMQVADTGFSTNCGAASAIAKFKSKACSVGADAIQLHSVRFPNSTTSTCYQASARFLKYIESSK